VANGIANVGRIPELRARLGYTLMMLAVYRVGIFIMIPGVDRERMAEYMQSASTGFLGLFNMFSGGAIEQMSVFALGIMPYISASIIIQLLTVVVPPLERLSKEGDQGRKKINQYTRYGAMGLAVVQGLMLLRSLAGQQDGPIVDAGTGWLMLAVLTVTTGTCFLMWIGEQITERGLGNGTSLIIYAGIVCELPDSIIRLFQLSESNGGTLTLTAIVLLGLIVLAVVGAIVFMERAQRRIPVQYAKKVVGRKQFGGQSTYLPLKLNTAGVIPPIFASSILMLPMTLLNLFPNSAWVVSMTNKLAPGAILYNVLFVALIIFFAYFYTAVTFNPLDVAENLKKSGGFIPGVRAGKKTADFIDAVLTRITFGGAVYIAAVCVLPTFLQQMWDVPFQFGGTGLLIVVGVALDTANQIQSYVISQNYEQFAQTGARQRTRGGVGTGAAR